MSNEVQVLLEALYTPTWKIHDPTKVMEFIRCPRKYFYSYVLGWKPETSNNHLVFGSAVHVAMDHILSNGFDNTNILKAHEKFLHEYRASLPEETDDLFTPKTPDNFLIVLAAYTQKYAADLDNFEVLYTEIAGEVSLTDDHSLAFRMDTILKDRKKGLYSSLEHKTGSSLYMWENQWDLSMQIGAYTHVLYCLFDPELVEGVRMNGMLFHKAKKGWEQLRSATPLTVKEPFTLIRYPAFKSKDQMQTWLWTIVHYLDQIQWNFEMLRECRLDDPVMFAFPQRHTACTDFNGCEWHDYCLSFQNPLQRCEEPPLGYAVDHWNPLEKEARHRFDLTEGGKDGGE